jgi:pimeloyl-ACP methyl ester carboxylesterase
VRILENAADAERTVIFVHGITSSASTWKPFLETLPDGVRGIAYDSLGSGYTERHGGRRPISRSDQRGLLLDVADALDADQFEIVAHSMGCGPALGAAWRHPDRVRGLLLVSPATQGRRKLGPTLRMARFGPAARLMELAAPLYVPRMARARVRAAVGGQPTAELIEREAGHAIAHPREQVRGFVDLAGHGDLRKSSTESEHYREIAVPVWILRGAGDLNWMPESHEDRYRELIPQARMVRWDGVGHSPHIEAPERFRKFLDEFLRDETKARGPGQGGGRAR